MQSCRAPEQAPFGCGSAEGVVVQIGPANDAGSFDLRGFERGKRLAYAHVAVGERCFFAHSQRDRAGGEHSSNEIAL